MKLIRRTKGWIVLLILCLSLPFMLSGFFSDIVLVRGEITAESVVIRAGTSGEVEKLYKEVGERVMRGELIMKLDPSDTGEELISARELLEELKGDKRGVEEEIKKAQVQVDYARGRYLTNKRLFSEGAIARMEVVRTKGEWDFAEEQKDKVEEKLLLITTRIKDAEDEIETMEERYDSVFVMSPIDGFIGRYLTWEGGYVLRGEEAIEVVYEGSIFFTGTYHSSSTPKPGDRAIVIPLRLGSGIIFGQVKDVLSDDGNGDDGSVVIRLFPETKRHIRAIGEGSIRSIAIIYPAGARY